MTRPVYVLGAGAHPWGKWPDKPQLQLALEAMQAALADAVLDWPDVEALVAASSRFEGGMGWGLHANEVVQAVAEQGVACINVGGACAAGAIAIHTAYAMIASGQYGRVRMIIFETPVPAPTAVNFRFCVSSLQLIVAAFLFALSSESPHKISA